MEIHYKNTLDDISAFAGFHFDHSETARLTIQRTRHLFSITMLIILALISWIVKSYTYLLVGVPVTIIFFIQFPDMMRTISINLVKRRYLEDRNIGLFEPLKISFSPDKILITSKHRENTVSWDSFNKILENDQFIYLYTAAASAFIIPKQSFDGSGADNFAKDAKEHIARAINKKKIGIRSEKDLSGKAR